MRFTALPLVLVAGVGFALPVAAQNDIGDILSNVAQTLMIQQADKAAYVRARSLDTESGYRAYFAQYPTGAYRADAEQALRSLGASEDAVTPPPLATATCAPPRLREPSA